MSTEETSASDRSYAAPGGQTSNESTWGAALGALAALHQAERRAAQQQLACPYCQDALRAAWLDDCTIRFWCSTCGFVEAPDRAGPVATP